MNTTIRGSHSGLRMAIALVAVLFVVALAFAVHQVATTSEPDLRATSAEGPGIANDPYIDRHAEVVARYQR